MKQIIFQGTEANRIVASQWGDEDGLPVILAHGGGQTRFAWEKSAWALAEKGFFAISYDHRGHGDSDWVPSQAYAFGDFAGDQIEIVRSIRATTGRNPAVIGASLGGISAMLLCQRGFGTALSAQILVDITPWMRADGVDKIQGFMRDRMVEGFASLEEAAAAIALYLPGRKPPKSLTGLSKNLRQGTDGRYRWHWDPATLDGPRPYGAESDTLVAKLEEGASLMHAPTLLLRGGKSELITKEHADRFLDIVPHAEFKDVAEAGHMVAGDDNDVFSALIIDFLTRALKV